MDIVLQLTVVRKQIQFLTMRDSQFAFYLSIEWIRETQSKSYTAYEAAQVRARRLHWGWVPEEDEESWKN